MAAALSLAERGVGRTGQNPSVGCIIVKDERVIGRGWTQPGGRPHAEAMALAQAGEAARGSKIYVTLEPCAHISQRGPACAQLLAEAEPARVVIALQDPDPRTAGSGIMLLKAAGIAVTTDVMVSEARKSLAGFISRMNRGRPFVTLKIASSLDGQIAMADGSSRWITGDVARAHSHVERARADAILVGAGTVRMDTPQLNVRIAGLDAYQPRKIMLGSADAPKGWEVIRTPQDIANLDCNTLLVEGGAATSAAFLRDGLVDRLVLYRAPILLGAGKACLNDIGLTQLQDAHGRWQLSDARSLGRDRFEDYEKAN
ncbi:bifunctional diaminohydroxyphosphoribosylaminopyrimidine deaminase/5-amino-6-(5-phosphoribosylamino)uracil reductase RibD [Sphingorhabdus wooponensis]|uniref:Riboflavin biosynthesis protein RibD n=1 Tax=Sphingorhabdus wooponensis TaxID=940136 RepID=A0A3R8Q1Q3_9SPHN|nr:bifunctional diaminohydroxyphosphoribosylaminopyrimidine deaminase/5-amino-6-(5-phosphoribosylamino)uracil reductase RibD [Sphingorhabdus wooponensis]RRQ51208.1 bifunctional diaminohydroxyphosphoribosylaminopyrimidine deaminase/5-amino-6-(5-phosphoribosylamino)uracil reductase RibD [Sphingorhabdus wooponensis]